ncbi:hypothetical protein C8034_v011986 [Colletotrichum sidae]|uniref:Uncharacterized protein n=2 Tax=Colletotrichum orbiculare species complex TaxID=2707354 RepID=A0A4R8QIB0_9PEZI|nr:hypothetical protein C8035_v010958 [Colletotrichum spinosum]TEA18811.1 hypothetical protein C8034_v011986 [Colletotrichum sidae]
MRNTPNAVMTLPSSVFGFPRKSRRDQVIKVGEDMRCQNTPQKRRTVHASVTLLKRGGQSPGSSSLKMQTKRMPRMEWAVSRKTKFSQTHEMLTTARSSS